MSGALVMQPVEYWNAGKLEYLAKNSNAILISRLILWLTWPGSKIIMVKPL
jgi:hypothetical protein